VPGTTLPSRASVHLMTAPKSCAFANLTSDDRKREGDLTSDWRREVMLCEERSSAMDEKISGESSPEYKRGKKGPVSKRTTGAQVSERTSGSNLLATSQDNFGCSRHIHLCIPAKCSVAVGRRLRYSSSAVIERCLPCRLLGRWMRPKCRRRIKGTALVPASSGLCCAGSLYWLRQGASPKFTKRIRQ